MPDKKEEAGNIEDDNKENATAKLSEGEKDVGSEKS